MTYYRAIAGVKFSHAECMGGKYIPGEVLMKARGWTVADESRDDYKAVLSYGQHKTHWDRLKQIDKRKVDGGFI